MRTAIVCLAFSAAITASTIATAKPGDMPRVAITVTRTGFEPAKVTVTKDVKTALVFTRTTDSTCAKEVVIPVGDQKIRKQLPLNQPVEIDVTFAKTGDLTYACGMDMATGVITVK